jgi:hypothetical protein
MSREKGFPVIFRPFLAFRRPRTGLGAELLAK